MGLDMYLTARLYVADDEIVQSAVDEIIPSEFKLKYVEAEAVYWRKVNFIHKWFVDNCQDGVDDCRDAYVSPRLLQELIDTCKTVLDNTDKATELLPCTNGVFFGSINTDDYYFKDIEYTLAKLIKTQKIIEEQEKQQKYWTLYYRSSW